MLGHDAACQDVGPSRQDTGAYEGNWNLPAPTRPKADPPRPNASSSRPRSTPRASAPATRSSANDSAARHWLATTQESSSPTGPCWRNSSPTSSLPHSKRRRSVWITLQRWSPYVTTTSSMCPLTGCRLKARGKGAPKKKKEAPVVHGMLTPVCLGHGWTLTRSSEKEEVGGGMRSLYDIPPEPRSGIPHLLGELGPWGGVFRRCLGHILLGAWDLAKDCGWTDPRDTLYHSKIERCCRLEYELMTIQLDDVSWATSLVMWERGSPMLELDVFSWESSDCAGEKNSLSTPRYCLVEVGDAGEHRISCLSTDRLAPVFHCYLKKAACSVCSGPVFSFVYVDSWLCRWQSVV